MKNNIPCEIIRDLLPLYIDELTSSKTNEEIEYHISNCSNCKELYEAEKKEWKEVSNITQEKKTIDYLRKVRNKGRYGIILGIAATLLVIIIILISKFYVIGTPFYGYEADIKVKAGTVYIEGEFREPKLAYSRYEVVEKNGESQLVVYGCRSSFWNSNKKIYIEYPVENIKQKLSISNTKVMKDGGILSKMAVDLYRERNPYIGDMPDNLELARTLNMSLGIEMLSSLQTTKEPYEWTFEFQPLLKEEEEIRINKAMPIYACALLALIDNAGEISWTYSLESDNGVKEYKKTITLEDAKTILGTDVKSFAVSEEKVQEMIDILGLK